MRKFKRNHNIGDDGIVCPKTWLLIMQLAKRIALKQQLQSVMECPSSQRDEEEDPPDEDETPVLSRTNSKLKYF